MLPTHVGMDRECGRCGLLLGHAPHARGDGPELGRPRRDFLDMLPTHVGMDRLEEGHEQHHQDAPHARGDGPPRNGTEPTSERCSPRTWGWTTNREPMPHRSAMLPTHVGMDRRSPAELGTRQHAPHARGDGPRGTSTSSVPD